MNRLLNRGKIPDRVNTYGTLEDDKDGEFQYEVKEYETREGFDTSVVEVDQQTKDKSELNESKVKTKHCIHIN